MITIAEQSVLTEYLNSIAIFLLLGLFVLYSTYWSRLSDFSNTLFKWLCLLIISDAVFVMAYYALRYQTIEKPHFIRMLLPTLDELATVLIVLLWVLYADYMLNGSKDRLKSFPGIFWWPILVISLCFLLNLLTGFLFTMDEQMLISYKPLFYLLKVVEYVYGLLPLFAVWKYTRRYGTLHFFSAVPVIIPSLVASLFSLFTDYSAKALGFSVGIIFLFFSYASKWRYDDEESSLYNRHYLSHLLNLAKAKKRDYQSAVFFRSDNASKDFFEILRTELPREGELIRLKHTTVLLLSENSRASTLSSILKLVQEAADEYDENHPDERAIDIITSVRKRKKNEDSAEFVRRVIA